MSRTSSRQRRPIASRQYECCGPKTCAAAQHLFTRSHTAAGHQSTTRGKGKGARRGLTIVRRVMLQHRAVFTQISGVHVWFGLVSIKRRPSTPAIIGRNAWVNAYFTINSVYAKCNKSVSENRKNYPKRRKKLSFGCILLDPTRNCTIQTCDANFKQGSISDHPGTQQPNIDATMISISHTDNNTFRALTLVRELDGNRV